VRSIALAGTLARIALLSAVLLGLVSAATCFSSARSLVQLVRHALVQLVLAHASVELATASHYLLLRHALVS
jgi:hypothetical protein